MAANKEPMAQRQPIAIVGMTCRFPGGATNPSKLWDLCTSGRDVWSAVPQDRFDGNSLYNTNSEKIGRHHVRGGYFLEGDVARFDAGFFNLPADVANALDPQIRQLLEVVYEATEDAGIPIHQLAGSNTSVFTGNWGMDYQDIQTRDPELITGPFVTSNTATFFASRISHFFDLRGQSMSIDTACSSGLVALHQACQSIWSGQSTKSIVGASSLILSQDLFVSMSTLGLLGPDGRCYAWDTRAQGYGRGEGVAALILKPLDVAVAEGDRIHAVIRDTGVNQDGKTTTITSPSINAQRDLIRACYQRAGLDLADTGYVEAHMTGTQVGDLVEAKALATTFGQAQKTGESILVGSVKTNIGHTEPVSGLAAIIKAVVSMNHHQITPNQNYAAPNPEIELDEWQLRVPTSLTEWPRGKSVRASINNFGAGGTNAHVILDGAPLFSKPQQLRIHINGDSIDASGPSRVYTLSASDSAACKEMAKRLSAHIRHHPPSPSDLAYTLSERRSRLPWVVAIRARSVEELAEALEAPALSPLYYTKQPRLGFVFNGQGAQWHAMGRELIAAYPIFAQSIRKADQALREYGAKWSLHDELLRSEAETRVAEVNIAQPISVALQLCLIDLLGSWGVHPSAITSHSSGEIAGAYAIGALTFEQALGVVYFRGELALKYQQLSTTPGGMVAAGVGADEASKYITDLREGQVVVACINSPESVTLSGDLAALDEVTSRLEQDGHFARKLKVPLAYHSHHMIPMEQEYIENLRSILPDTCKWNDAILFASPVSGTLVSSHHLTAEHWAQNLTNPVRFSEAFEALCVADVCPDIVVEIGAHSTLAGPIRQILKGRKMAYTSCLKRSMNAVETMQDLACELVSRGYPVNLRAANAPLDRDSPAFTPDLPSYPWNHSIRYWLESRINKDTRYKKFTPHELLGLPISGGTSALPTWRNFLRLPDLPWLVDHQVDSKVVLPGAAYVTMAIEAVRLLTLPTVSSSSSLPSLGFRLRDVNIMNALTIPESSEGVEVHTRLSPCSDRDLDHRGWYEFEISSVDTTGSWITNCQGHVSALPDTANKSVLHRDTESPHADSYLDAGRKIRNSDIASLYATMRRMNICHGPAFQNLLDCQVQGAKSLSTISVPAVASGTFDYIIHPTTLDTIIQAIFGGVPQDLSEKYMLLPRSIGSIVIPSDLNTQEAGSQLKVFTELRKSSNRGLLSNVAVGRAKGDTAMSPSCIRMEDFYLQAVPLDLDDTAGEAKGPVSFQSRWELDVLHSIPSAVKDSLKIYLSDEEAELERKLLRCSFDFIHDAVLELRDEPKQNWAWHHRAMYQWMEHIVQLASSGLLHTGFKGWANASKGMKRIRHDELEASGACGKLTVRVGRQLAAILRGKVNAIELMMEGDLLNQYYMKIPRLESRTYKHLRRVVELYAAKNPGAHVLEIGAGTGGATQTVLEAFAGSQGGNGCSLLGRYTFTDVSQGFFPAARQKLAAWTSVMEFAELDIESDPAAQSFVPGSYDLIVASEVLHATKNLEKTTARVRQLLKPGGKLLMVETTQDQLDMHLIFGNFEGWWLSEEPSRKLSPNVGLKVWDDVLKSTGFSGIDFDIGDCEDPQFQGCSVMLSTALRTTPSYAPDISIVCANEPPSEWLAQLSTGIQRLTGNLPQIEAFSGLGNVQGRLCVFVAEMTQPLLDGIDKERFEDLRSLVTNCQGLLWLGCGSLIDSKFPAYSQTPGYLRTLRLERSDSRFAHLDFEHTDEPWSKDKIPFILHVLGESFDMSRPLHEVEWEYSVNGGALHVPRVYPGSDFVGRADDIGAPRHRPELFCQPGRTLVWEPPTTGMLSDLAFTDGADMSGGEVLDGMVQIEAKAFGLNFRDVMIALGQLDDTLVGHDVAGIVTALGPNTEQSGLQVGDRVCGLGQGRFANTCRAYWTGVAKLPEELSWKDGAAIPVVYITAYHCLVRLGGLQRGQTVLVHAATGGVGQAAIVVAQHIGAHVFATCSTKEKKKLLIEDYGIDASHIFSSRDESFAAGVMTATKGKGIDVVLNSLSGSLLKATWSCIARFGRFIEIGKVDIEASRSLNMAPFGRCAMYSGFDALQLNEYDGLSTREAITASVRICHERIVNVGNKHPLYPIEEHSISDLEKAMRLMQSGLHVGKLVLIPREGDRVNVVTRPQSITKPDATYLIVGGAGGVGRSLASWLISKGAKSLILTSRNAEANPEALKIVETAREEGCVVHIRNCDIANETSVEDLLAYHSEVGLPPIKGIINGAMVLRDSVFESMTFEQWQSAVETKVKSSTNLHNHLSNLDFFILLSSIIGQIGNVSQSNYGAGNSFEDALARHRTSLGLPSLSVDLSGITDAGFVASQQLADGTNQVQRRVEGLGTVSIAMEDIQHVLERAVLHLTSSPHDENSSSGASSSSSAADDAQVIMGLASWDSLPESSVVRSDRRFGTLRLTCESNNPGSAAAGAANAAAATNNPARMLQQALSMIDAEERTQAVAQAVAERLAVIFNVSVAQIDCTAPVALNGVDSLVAVELRNWLAGSAKAKVSIFEVVQSSSLLEFANLIVERSYIVNEQKR